MHTLLIGLLGALLLTVGPQMTDPCDSTYRLSLQPADSVADPPDETVHEESLTETQRVAVEATLLDSRLTVRDRSQLEPLTDAVLVVDGERYVAELVEIPCRSPYDELALGGFGGATIGFFLALYAVVAWRFS